LELGRLTEAETILRGLLDSDATASVLLVDLLSESGRAAEALQVARSGLEGQGAGPPAWAALAVALQRAGQHHEAVEALTEARRLGPDDGWVAWAADIVEAKEGP
jgi:Flp pilus assembly protein TadD